MKLAIIGLPAAGKSTVFQALTSVVIDPGKRAERQIGTVTVPDPRVDLLHRMYRPRKTVYAQVEYLLPGLGTRKNDGKSEQTPWTQVRDCDALIHLIRNFSAYGMPPPAIRKDFTALEQELMLTDLMAVEKRIERLELDHRRGKINSIDELTLLKQCREMLEDEIPLRKDPDLAADPLLRGFAFLSAKPVLVLFNNDDEDDSLPGEDQVPAGEICMMIRGKLEEELSQMSAGEAAEFLAEFNIRASARDRVLQRSYSLLGLISFFTFGEKEVHAWTIPKASPATEAAGAVHTDMKKGFIRAEVLAYDDLVATGSFAEARKKGLVRLEGKAYQVQDGDLITFRFNV